MGVLLKREHVCPPDREQVAYIGLLVNPMNFLVIVQRKDDKYLFPRVNSPEVPFRGRLMSECFSRRFEELTGTRYDLVFLYCTRNETLSRGVAGMHRAIFECVAPIDPDTDEPVKPASEEYEWMPIPEARRLILDGEKWIDIEDIMAVQDLDRDEILEMREDELRPWELPTWFDTTTKEASSVLHKLGYTTKNFFEQHTVSCHSTVLRVDTEKGRVYLKASNKSEGRVTEYIGGFAPYLARKPLYVNAEKEWMLMEDYGKALFEKFTRSDYEKLVPLHGKLQLESRDHIAELIAAGVEQVDVEGLISKFGKMLEDEEVRSGLREMKGFSNVDEEGKAELSKYFEAVCEFLRWMYEPGRFPLALVHGDVHDGNIIRCRGDEGELILFDWDAARIDIPFIDVVFLETEVRPEKDQKNDGIDWYLEMWREYGSISELRQMSADCTFKKCIVWWTDLFHYAKKYCEIPLFTVRQLESLKNHMEIVLKRVKEIRG
ncbi:hypothetical protein BWQ96_00991 [Gracilariopsis chorda]|uniref:Aminoglycoside phosphotransferase domain-containing protein n=1 Tax=Gracilariopsis chorda TaxID=448386 RepID=A0A2V3J503_9FLOR|nr:hypothetical protein BWQ96_00991 [Gracilariopsis chorda]|eukprot:PXF49202.1 hypothetical protein BWQ96_00991 [Gracilariopsis chorda]